MSYRTPTSRLKSRKGERLNLIPILDAVFIFIFFLLMSAQFIKIYEIGSDVPIISSAPPPKEQKKPLALTLKVHSKGFTLYRGVPSSAYKSIGKLPSGEYDLNSLHDHLVEMKKNFTHEKSIVLEPVINLDYKTIVDIMDAVRMLKHTDDAIYTKDADGLDVKINTLFHKILFGNLMS